MYSVDNFSVRREAFYVSVPFLGYKSVRLDLQALFAGKLECLSFNKFWHVVRIYCRNEMSYLYTIKYDMDLILCT